MHNTSFARTIPARVRRKIAWHGPQKHVTTRRFMMLRKQLDTSLSLDYMNTKIQLQHFFSRGRGVIVMSTCADRDELPERDRYWRKMSAHATKCVTHTKLLRSNVLGGKITNLFQANENIPKFRLNRPWFVLFCSLCIQGPIRQLYVEYMERTRGARRGRTTTRERK